MSAPALFDVDTPEPVPLRRSMDDHHRGRLLIEALVPGCTEMRSIIIDGPPTSKTRARFTKSGKAYKLKEDRDAEERTAEHLKRIIHEPLTGNVALACVFYRPNRQRIDADNMLKHVCDAANGVVWHDDSQATAIAATVELDRHHPRTVIVIAEHESTLVRDASQVIGCERCGAPFPKGTKRKRLCSRGCQVDDLNSLNRKRSFRKANCLTCGKETSRHDVQRCRSCWAKRGTAAQSVPPHLGAAT